jgi:glycosyltransferase involved in cell wall biosynthesis
VRPDQNSARAGEPLVTVAIPCHNEADALARTLAALAAQEGGADDLEVVLVDNLSDDRRVAEVAARYAELLDLKFISQDELEHPYALCRARNLALERACGRWFWTLDSDCMANPGFLATLRRLDRARTRAERPAFTGERVFVDATGLAEADLLAGRAEAAEAPRVRSFSNYGLARDRRFPVLPALPDVDHPWDLLHGGNTVFETRLGREAGGYDEGFDGCWGYEDDEFAYRLITDAGAVPRWHPGLAVYHQEPVDTPAYDRLEKEANPNWHRVCGLIPGYRDYKLAAFAHRGIPVRAGAGLGG